MKNAIKTKLSKKFLFTLILSGTFASYSQVSDNTATLSAKVDLANAVVKNLDLNFGNFLASGTQGTVTLDNLHSITVGGGVSASAVPISPSSGEFEVSGAVGDTYTIGYTSSVTLNRAGGGATMTASTFTSTVVDGDGTLLTLPSDGTQKFRTGGVLAVGANQMSGDYISSAGDFVVTITF